jgi:hypothetical protein
VSGVWSACRIQRDTFDVSRIQREMLHALTSGVKTWTSVLVSLELRYTWHASRSGVPSLGAVKGNVTHHLSWKNELVVR